MEITSENKKKYFEYFLRSLIDWNKDYKGLKTDDDFNHNNDLTKLKVLKLNFFVSASNNCELLQVFNNFYAMPYGHVESDVYKSLNSLSSFCISKSGTRVIEDVNTEGLSDELMEVIDKSVNDLKSANPEIIGYNALQLVDLSHQWSSWKTMFSFARSQGRFSESIPVEVIRRENKYFKL